MGWMRANLAYDRLSRRHLLTPLEERLCLVVFMRRQATHYLELRLQAEAGRTEHNGRALDKLLEELRNQMFPGLETRDNWETQARELLAREVKKLYLVKPLRGRARVAELERAATRAPTRQWAVDELKKEATRPRSRLKRKNRGDLPPGTVRDRRTD